MDLLTFLRVLLRRWDVVLPGCILTLVTVIAAGSTVAPEYEAQGSLLLLGPSTSSSSQGAAPTNPYLNIPGSLDSTAVIMAESMSGEETIRDLANVGATADFEVTPTEKTPILTVTAGGPNRDQVLLTADLVIQRIQDDLARRQLGAGAPAQTLIRSEVLSPPVVSMHVGSKPRVMAAVGALGVGVTVLLAFGVENLAAGRTRRRLGETAQAPIGYGVADMPFVFSGPAPHPVPDSAPHFDAPSEAAYSNGWHAQPPSGPLVDLVVEPADTSPVEDPVEDRTVEEAPAQNVAPGDDGSTEQHDGLVDAWWMAWERRQAVRGHAHDLLLEDTTQEPDENRAWQAEEAGSENEDAATTTRLPTASDDDENSRWNEDFIDPMPQSDQSESVPAWGGDIEVLRGTPHVERGTPSTWPHPRR